MSVFKSSFAPFRRGVEVLFPGWGDIVDAHAGCAVNEMDWEWQKSSVVAQIMQDVIRFELGSGIRFCAQENGCAGFGTRFIESTERVAAIRAPTPLQGGLTRFSGLSDHDDLVCHEKTGEQSNAKLADELLTLAGKFVAF